MIDVSALTEKGFVGSATYAGKRVDLQFDDGGAGVFLTPEMAGRLHVRKGSKVLLTIEDDLNQMVEAAVAGVVTSPRFSDPKAYYAVGRDGGAIVRVRRA